MLTACDRNNSNVFGSDHRSEALHAIYPEKKEGNQRCLTGDALRCNLSTFCWGKCRGKPDEHDNSRNAWICRSNNAQQSATQLNMSRLHRRVLLCSERAVADGMRAILIRSDLRHFCAGADVSALDSGGVDASVTLDRLESIPIPPSRPFMAPCWAADLNLPWPATLLLLPSQRKLAP